MDIKTYRSKGIRGRSRGRDSNKGAKTCGNSLRDLVTEVVIVCVILILVFRFVFGITVQQGNDMYPAIKDGDLVLYFRTHNIVNTEAVVYSVRGSTHTGRVEASPGSVVSAAGDLQLMVDGIFLPVSRDDGIYSRTYALEEQKLPVKIKDDHYYVLGDNRDDSQDSRSYGQISRRNIRGRVIAVLRRRQI